MTGINRLSAPHGRLIDRSREIEFTFEGQTFTGLAGDTIASALAANDAWILSRSFKYHRPRGILTMAGMDANALVQVGDEPSVLADRRLISDGIAVTGQNYVGSLLNDRDAWMDRIGRFCRWASTTRRSTSRKAPGSGGAYIRRKAGLGVVTTAAHHGYFDKEYLFADVAVIGGRPGIAAARSGQGGGEVILIDENATRWISTYARFDAAGHRDRAGGGTDRGAPCRRQYPRDDRYHLHRPVRRQLAGAGQGHASLQAAHQIGGDRRGSLEQPAVFRHNDLPGVMMGSAAQRSIRHYGIRSRPPCRRADRELDGYGVARISRMPAFNSAVVDLRSDTGTSETVTAVNELGVPILTGCTSPEMMHSHGKHHITGCADLPASPARGPARSRAHHRMRSALHVRRLHANIAFAAPPQRQIRLQQIDGDVRGRPRCRPMSLPQARSPALTISTP
jgi:sarcosine oxidase subunit alpha